MDHLAVYSPANVTYQPETVGFSSDMLTKPFVVFIDILSVLLFHATQS